MSLKICLVGADGRMGEAIQKVLKPAVVVDRKQKFKKISDVDPKKIDVVIEFASVEATGECAKWCAEHKKPLVTGTTGLSPEVQKQILAASKKVAILQSANMSTGVSLLAEVLKQFGKALSGYDVEIEEIHHKHKKDNPSGTAKLLKASLEKSYKGNLKEPVGLRGGEVFGVHRIYLMGPGETLTFEHQALGREVFAQGAVKAAQWIKGKSAGMYSMWDVLK